MDDRDTPAPDRIEPLEDPRHEGGHVVAGVLSNGCTTSEAFGVEHAVADGRCLVTVVRPVPDRCRGATRVVSVRIPWTPPRACADLEVEFANPALGPLPRTPGRRLRDEGTPPE